MGIFNETHPIYPHKQWKIKVARTSTQAAMTTEHRLPDRPTPGTGLLGAARTVWHVRQDRPVALGTLP